MRPYSRCRMLVGRWERAGTALDVTLLSANVSLRWKSRQLTRMISPLPSAAHHTSAFAPQRATLDAERSTAA
jgi:hypothetical protein